ncbi:hypothetical protein GUJ93_ZPchr0011g28682 [Zizania palustris]|uniref:Uncharacterized protein n=1 Tax=Zizania palustris TaxID=103762 RepID=A0A8J6BN53_ZIZPA|nr:hypothetical protein GUJ93_ZPchr0011g28682 [Zizania palustris]
MRTADDSECGSHERQHPSRNSVRQLFIVSAASAPPDLSWPVGSGHRRAEGRDWSASSGLRFCLPVVLRLSSCLIRFHDGRRICS